MLHLDKYTTIPTVEQTMNTLKMHNSMMPTYVDYDMLLMSIFKVNTLISAYDREFFNILGYRDKVRRTDALKEFIVNAGITGRFARTPGGEISLDKTSLTLALQSGLTEEQQVVIKLYQASSAYEKIRSQLVPFLQNPMSDKLSFDGHRMLEVRPQWASQNTGRVAMAKPAIQNMNRNIQSLITVPKGYKLIHCDSGQVEPRIIYSTFLCDKQIQALIRLYNDAYFGVLHYVTMPEQHIYDGRLTFEKKEITDELKAKRSQIKTYGNAVMYGATSNKEGDPIKDAMIKRIGNHPSRLQKLEEIKYIIDRGETVFRTYFGTPIDAAKSDKLVKGSYNYRDELMKLGINNPIQGTAADLMRYSVHQANRILAGVKDSYIVNYIHDAGTFCVSEDEFDLIGEQLMDIVGYDVEGWLPIEADGEVRTHITENVFTKFPY